ncbi:MAG: hypothetical protein M5U19_22760 [Microthrixaceae bacterium]|nr:hypothetical protein [Microthrixaceae bacterium]
MREFTTLGDSTGALLSEWWTGWRSAGIGEPSLPPAGVPGLGVLGTILWLSAGAARRVLVLAPLILGPLGAWRLFARGTSFRARSAMVAVYGLSPIALNAMGEARLQAMVAYAAAPWVLRRISRRAGLVPLRSRAFEVARECPWSAACASAPPRLRDYAGTAVLVGVVAALSPLAALVTVVAVALMMIGPALSGSLAAAGSAWRHLAVAVLGAVALNLPWLVSAARGGDLASLTGLWVGRGPVPSAADMLTGSLGSLQAGLLGWGFVVAAAVPLFTGRSWRSGWAVGAWIAIAAGLLAAVLAGEADLLAGAGGGGAVGAGCPRPGGIERDGATGFRGGCREGRLRQPADHHLHRGGSAVRGDGAPGPRRYAGTLVPPRGRLRSCAHPRGRWGRFQGDVDRRSRCAAAGGGPWIRSRG